MDEEKQMGNGMPHGERSMDELSTAELEGQLCVELPTRALMRHRRHRRGFARGYGYGHYGNGGYGYGGYGYGGYGGTFASFGSAAASNTTFQSNFNPQIAVNNGFVGGGFGISSFNSNANFTNQVLTPVNIGF
jgi:hypothetical protein